MSTETWPRDERFTVTEDHLKLARAMNVRYEDWLEFGAPAVDPKRPYGNGDVYADMRRILGRPALAEDEVPTDEDELLRLHKEMATVLQIALCTGSFTAGEYNARPYLMDWEPA